MTGITSDWAMSMIKDNLATPRDLSSFQAWRESSKHGQEEKSQNMINVQLAHEKSHFEHRSCNNSNLGEGVAHAQPSHEEEEIQNSNLEHESSKHPHFYHPEEDDRKPAAKRIKKEPEDETQSWAQEEMTEKPTPKPWEDKKDYQAIFRKYIPIG